MMDSVVNLLSEMVRIDSVGTPITGRPEAERELARWLEKTAGQFGLTTRRLAVRDRGFNLLVTHEKSGTAPWLLFESHMDTVGVEGMTIPPFEPEIRDGRMYGRGSCDTKGSGAAMLWALKSYAADASAAANNIALLFTIDEEIAKTGINSFVTNDLPALPWRPAGAVVGEPTMLQPIVAHNGVVRWTIRTEGLAAHSSDPSQGRSAISMMVKVIDALESRYIPSLEASHPLTGPAACSINLIRGGTQINVIPASCTIEIDRRIVPGEDGNSVLPKVEAILNELRRSDPHLKVLQQTPFIDPALDPAGGEAFAAHVGQIVSQQGFNGVPAGVAYGTDGGNLAVAGIPVVVLGPGDIAQAHKAEEWLELDQLHKAVRVYQSLMRTPMD